MVLQWQDIDIADRLQIIGLQKVFDALGQLGSVLAKGTGKNNFQIKSCRQRHLNGLLVLAGAGDAGKISLGAMKFMLYKKAFLV